MSSIALLLGPIELRDFEVPSKINIGGSQRLVVHRLPGGTRVIDALGRDDAEIVFSGSFSGSDATTRARLIDEMRVSGLPMPLTWDVFFYYVIIKQFDADYRFGWWIPYRITCTVVCDAASGVVGSAVSLATDVISDISTASGFATDGGVDLSDAESAVGAPDAAVKGSASYSSALGALASTSIVIGVGIDKAESTLAATSWPSSGGVSSMANTLYSVVAAAQQLSSLTVAQAYVGRSGVNLANAST